MHSAELVRVLKARVDRVTTTVSVQRVRVATVSVRAQKMWTAVEMAD